MSILQDQRVYRACRSKKPFPTLAKVKKAARDLSGPRRRKMYFYMCGYCQGFHLTKSKP